LYQPPPLRWNADSEIFFTTSDDSHSGHGGLAAPARTIFSNSW